MSHPSDEAAVIRRTMGGVMLNFGGRFGAGNGSLRTFIDAAAMADPPFSAARSRLIAADRLMDLW